MAKLVPADAAEGGHLVEVVGWLEDDDPFFTRLDEVAAARGTHRPRIDGLGVESWWTGDAP